MLMTFDDWPTEYTLPIAKMLKSKNIRGKFFFIWKKIKGNEHIVKQVHDMWFEIWCHTYSHTNITEHTLVSNYLSISRTNKMIEKITWEKVTAFRPPFWKIDSAQWKLLQWMWMRVWRSLSWHVFSTSDWRLRDLELVKQRYHAEKKDYHTEILQHDIYDFVVPMTQYLVDSF